MERSHKTLFLLVICLIMLGVGYFIYSHKSSQVKPSSEMKTGIKALTDPEALIKDLEK